MRHDDPTDPTSSPEKQRHLQLPRGAGGALVFLSSGAVLVLEILSLRLVAPYAGLTLQVSTAVISSALAAIALGAWIGGRLADSSNPRALLGPALAVSGVTTLLVLPAVRWAGHFLQGQGAGAVVLLAMLAIFIPAALLSAISPLVVKLQLSNVTHTGKIVGRYSALGTGGAIVASFLTGFVFVALFATSTLLTALGVALLALAVGTHLWVGTRRFGARAAGASAGGAAVLGLAFAVPLPQACHEETLYSCVWVQEDPRRPSGRYLIVNNGMQSYVDLEDPLYLRFEYSKVFASVLEHVRSEMGRPLRVLHVGGGGSTVPRYVRARDPGSENTVYEIDRGLIELSRKRLGLVTGEGLRVEAADARIAVKSDADDHYDIVFGDAFGSGTPPWHLTTVEAMRDIDRVLAPHGFYAVNLVDFPPFGFLGAELATLREVFPHVALFSKPQAISLHAPSGEVRGDGGNAVVVASHQPVPLERLRESVRALNGEMIAQPEAVTARLMKEAPVLTDDYAPVDQLVNFPTQRILGSQPL